MLVGGEVMWRCSCERRCTILTLERDDESLYLCYYTGMDEKLRWKPYFKNLWKALTGRAYLVREVVLNADDAIAMADWILEEDWSEA